MAPRYTRKQLHSLKELDREQARLKRLCRNVEQNWWQELINPQEIGLSLISIFLATKNRRKNKLLQPAGKAVSEKGGTAPGQTLLSMITTGKRAPLLLKAIGVSLMRWQAFNLAFFIGKKVVNGIKARKMRKKYQLK